MSWRSLQKTQTWFPVFISGGSQTPVSLSLRMISSSSFHSYLYSHADFHTRNTHIIFNLKTPVMEKGALQVHEWCKHAGLTSSTEVKRKSPF